MPRPRISDWTQVAGENRSEKPTPNINESTGSDTGTSTERITPSTCETGESEISTSYEIPQSLQSLSVSPAQIEAAKSAMASASRDEAGFVSGSSVHITEAQFGWLTYRMGLDSDNAATIMSGLDPSIVIMWFRDPDFIATYESILENKREGFRTLIPHLNGKVLRRINDMLDSESVTLQKAGVNFALRSQGLLIDTIKTVDKGKMEQLLESLRSEKAVTIMDAQVRDVPDGS
jgi:hypothetical protein